jgi:hypothetical protein
MDFDLHNFNISDLEKKITYSELIELYSLLIYEIKTSLPNSNFLDKSNSVDLLKQHITIKTEPQENISVENVPVKVIKLLEDNKEYYLDLNGNIYHGTEQQIRLIDHISNIPNFKSKIMCLKSDDLKSAKTKNGTVVYKHINGHIYKKLTNQLYLMLR